MQVQDIMTTRVITASPSTTVLELVRLLLENRISGVPVVDEQERLVGIVGEDELIRQLTDVDSPKRSWWQSLIAPPEDQAERYLRSHGQIAADIMSRELMTVVESTTIGEAARLLEESRLRHLPVVREGRLVGIVSRSDLLRMLVTQAPPSAAPQDDDAIRNAVMAELERAGQAHHPYLEVTVQDRVVYLKGFIYNQREADAILVAARNVPGVDRVESQLVIRPVAGIH